MNLALDKGGILQGMPSHEIKLLEKKMEEILITFEQNDQYREALQGYNMIEMKIKHLLDSLSSEDVNSAYGVLAQCHFRQGNMHRSLGQAAEAPRYSEMEAEAARQSGYAATIAQSIFSEGVTLISNKHLSKGLSFLEKAKELFDQGDNYDCIQGRGWYWIIKADLGNKGITETTPEEIIEFSNNALEILAPIENWRGISRAYLARSIAYRSIGEMKLADRDFAKTKEYE
ncbi:hypothetical protein ACIQXV_20845 [Neobacillus sp. NPDC097160]|uniref:hypothetical protein n=1 Tax=Neobacillus sp. NPDC097160 TaxID=3364298 RepID=UPI00380FC77E